MQILLLEKPQNEIHGADSLGQVTVLDRETHLHNTTYKYNRRTVTLLIRTIASG